MTRQANFLVIFLSIYIILADVCDYEVNTDRPYNDIDTIHTASPASCCSECEKLSSCQAWTLSAPGGPREGCHRKKVIPPKGTFQSGVPCNNYCTSGTKPIPSQCKSKVGFEISTDRPGSDILDADFSDGPEACCAACAANANCKAWTYVFNWTSPYNGCHLKNSNVPIALTSCGDRCISGLKESCAAGTIDEIINYVTPLIIKNEAFCGLCYMDPKIETIGFGFNLGEEQEKKNCYFKTIISIYRC